MVVVYCNMISLRVLTFMGLACLAAAAPTAEVVAAVGRCTEGYTELWMDTEHIMSTCIKFTSKTGSWGDMVAYCENEGATLARPFGPLLDEVIKHIKEDPELQGGHGFWIGGSNIASEATWAWINGDPMPMTTPPWMGGQPDFTTIEHYCCLYKPEFLFNSCGKLEPLPALCQI